MPYAGKPKLYDKAEVADRPATSGHELISSLRGVDLNWINICEGDWAYPLTNTALFPFLQTSCKPVAFWKYTLSYISWLNSLPPFIPYSGHFFPSFQSLFKCLLRMPYSEHPMKSLFQSIQFLYSLELRKIGNYLLAYCPSLFCDIL